jgi:hypothetical protein
MTYLPDRRALFLVAIAGLTVVAMAQEQQPSVRVLSPANGAVVDGRNVELRMDVKGVRLTPRPSSNAAYVLLRLDDAPPVKAYSDSFTFQEVNPGSHVVRVELRRSNGGAFNPPVRTRVRFAVRAEQR